MRPLLNSMDLNKITHRSWRSQDLGATTNDFKDEKAYQN